EWRMRTRILVFILTGGVSWLRWIYYLDLPQMSLAKMNKFLLVVGLLGCVVVHGGTSNHTVDGVWYGEYV
ncbi:hypothetical protein BGZ57DRAFT_881250, partial [Hyaloscypha finlandica]